MIRKLLLLLPHSRRQREHILNEELQSYLEMAEEEARRTGLAAEEARFAARRDLGNLLHAKEAVRAEWIPRQLENVWHDLRYAFRSLRRAPVFTVIAVLSLALGIGAANSVFAIVNGVLLKPLAYSDSSRLVYINEVVPALSQVYPKLPVNIRHFCYWQQHTRTFQSLAALRASRPTLTGSGEPLQIDGVETTDSLFKVLKTTLALGRDFLAGESRPGKNNVAIITHALWTSHFHATPGILGTQIYLDGVSVTVIGVLPPGFTFPKSAELGALSGLGKHTDIFQPLGDTNPGWDGDYDFLVIGRLHSGVSLPRGLAELTILTRQLAAEHQVQSKPYPAVRPLQDVIAGSVRGSLFLLLASVLVLLLIVCVNLANLMLARAHARIREFSIRTALGAARGRLFQQLLTEAALLSLVGGALGVLLSLAAVQVFASLPDLPIPRLNEVHVDKFVILFSVAVTAACAALCGLAPAYRVSKANLQEAMRSAGQSVTANRHSLRSREWLVGCEVALSTVLVFLAGLLVSSLLHLMHTDKGFHEERALAIDLSLPGNTAPTRFFDRAIAQLSLLPGVHSVGLINQLPLTGETQVNGIQPEGAAQESLDPATHTEILINVRFISPGYFQTLGFPLLSGRDIAPQDRSRKVAVISARLAAKVWPGQNPIGRKFTTGSDVGQVQVVGIVRDTYNGRLDEQPTLIAYVPYWVRPLQYGSLVIRASTDPLVLIPAARKIIWSIDPTLPVSEVRTMSDIVSMATKQRRLQVRLAVAFGIAALLLALIGIYGVVAYNVHQRRGELGVRLALGAKPSELVSLMLKRGLLPVALGLLSGVALSGALGAFVRSLVFGITTTDPATLLCVVALLAATAFLACLLPASRVAHMRPADILRHQ